MMTSKAIALLLFCAGGSTFAESQIDSEISTQLSKLQDLQNKKAMEDQDTQPKIRVVGDNLDIRLPRDADMTISRRTTISVTDLANRLKAVEDNQDDFASKNTVNQISAQTQVTAYHASANATSTMYDKLLDMASEIKNLKSDLTAEIDTFKTAQADALSTQAKGLEDGLAAMEAESDKKINAFSAKSSACNKAGNYLDANNKCVAFPVLNLAENKATTCTVKGQMRYNPTTGMTELCNGKTYDTGPSSQSKVTFRHFISSQGMDNGYVPDRWIKFTKTEKSSLMKILYYDNSRIYGCNGCAADWELRICDGNGNNCQRCSSPSRLTVNKYTAYGGASYSNLHHPIALSGVCAKAGPHLVNPGKYMLKVKVASSQDAYTGHNGQTGSLLVQEISGISGG